jgi:hypothetical protein
VFVQVRKAKNTKRTTKNDSLGKTIDLLDKGQMGSNLHKRPAKNTKKAAASSKLTAAFQITVND